jgi:hypothetical protein
MEMQRAPLAGDIDELAEQVAAGAESGDAANWFGAKTCIAPRGGADDFVTS